MSLLFKNTMWCGSDRAGSDRTLRTASQHQQDVDTSSRGVAGRRRRAHEVTRRRRSSEGRPGSGSLWLQVLLTRLFLLVGVLTTEPRSSPDEHLGRTLQNHKVLINKPKKPNQMFSKKLCWADVRTGSGFGLSEICPTVFYLLHLTESLLWEKETKQLL